MANLEHQSKNRLAEVIKLGEGGLILNESHKALNEVKEFVALSLAHDLDWKEEDESQEDVEVVFLK